MFPAFFLFFPFVALFTFWSSPRVATSPPVVAAARPVSMPSHEDGYAAVKDKLRRKDRYPAVSLAEIVDALDHSANTVDDEQRGDDEIDYVDDSSPIH